MEEEIMIWPSLFINNLSYRVKEIYFNVL